MPPRWGVMQSTILRTARTTALLAGVAFALPITCARPSDGIYTGGIEPSPASRVNPAEPGFTNDSGQSK
jgi:hypothetical protein